jgi:hypothetical protein
MKFNFPDSKPPTLFTASAAFLYLLFAGCVRRARFSLVETVNSLGEGHLRENFKDIL